MVVDAKLVDSKIRFGVESQSVNQSAYHDLDSSFSTDCSVAVFSGNFPSISLQFS